MTTQISWDGGAIDLADHTARELGVKSNDRALSGPLGAARGQRNFSPRTISITQDVVDWQANGPAFLDLLNAVGRETPFTFTSDTLGTLTVRLASYRPMTKRYFGSYSFLLEEHLA